MSLLFDMLDRIAGIGALPADVERCASNHILDIVGVGAASATTRMGIPWLRYAAGVVRPDGAATVIGAGGGADPAEAALINGGLMHSLEYDDTHTGAIAHGSAVLAGAALAVGEAEGRSGREILDAYAIWYEVLIRMGLSAAGGFQARGFQFTAIGGALCAAGIAAQLRGLSRDETAAAVGIALSQASGVFAFLSNGATVKSMHPGWAAHSGIKAAALAAAGITGPDKPFDDTYGLFRVFADSPDGAARFAGHLSDLGGRWHLRDVAFKFLPCCHYIHPFVEAAKLLLPDPVASTSIVGMVFRVPEAAAPIVCEPWEERCRAQGHAARWSLPVVTAMQICDGQVTLDSFDGPVGSDVLDLARRSRWLPLENSNFPTRFEADLEIELDTGETRRKFVEDVYGNASRAPSDSDIRKKFDDNMSRSLDPDTVSALAGALTGIGHETDTRAIARYLRKMTPREGSQ